MSTKLDTTEEKKIYQEFKKLVNMTPAALEKWLKTDESKSVGWDSGDGESIGHKSGEKIVDILHTKEADLKPDDYKHMQKVVSYIKRHLAQKPAGDDSKTNWNYSLKNWGHDYSK